MVMFVSDKYDMFYLAKIIVTSVKWNKRG